jgi:hypothetical protein
VQDLNIGIIDDNDQRNDPDLKHHNQLLNTFGFLWQWLLALCLSLHISGLDGLPLHPFLSLFLCCRACGSVLGVYFFSPDFSIIWRIRIIMQQVHWLPALSLGVALELAFRYLLVL